MQESSAKNLVASPETSLHTVAEFRSRVVSYYRGGLKWMAAFAAGMIAFYGVFFVVCAYFGPEPQPAPQPLAGSLLILFFLGQFLVIGAFGTVIDRSMRTAAVTCKSCGEQLDVRYDLQTAIAIHCCPYCQNPLFKEWSDPSAIMALTGAAHPAEGEFTFADISEGEKKRSQSMKICFALTVAAGAVVFGITLAALWVRYDLLTARFGDLAPEVTNLMSFIPALVVLGVGFFWSLCRTPGAFPSCGGCGTRIEDRSLTRATGNCITCGRRVIRDAPLLRCDDVASEVNLMVLAEFNARVRRYGLLTLCSFGMLGVGVIAWFRLVIWWFGNQVHDQSKIMENVTVFSGVGVLLLVFIGIMAWLVPRPRCPHCQAPLDDSRSLVRATGNCGHCGCRVLECQHRSGQ